MCSITATVLYQNNYNAHKAMSESSFEKAWNWTEDSSMDLKLLNFFQQSQWNLAISFKIKTNQEKKKDR